MPTVAVANTSAALSGKTIVLAEADQTITGLQSFNRTTNPPFAVNPGAGVVANLDADKLDGLDASSFVLSTERLALILASDGGTSPVATADRTLTLPVLGPNDWLRVSIVVGISGITTPVVVELLTYDGVNAGGITLTGATGGGDLTSNLTMMFMVDIRPTAPFGGTPTLQGLATGQLTLLAQQRGFTYGSFWVYDPNSATRVMVLRYSGLQAGAVFGWSWTVTRLKG